MEANELQDHAIETIKFYTELGNEIFKQSMPTPLVDFSVKGRVGGKYSTRDHKVMVNMVLYSENFEEYIENTIPHEVAHAFQRHMYGAYFNFKRVMPHGNEWKRIMLALGKQPARTHKYDVSNATRRTVARNYVYLCKCSTHQLTAIRHRRIESGTIYRCNNCKAALSKQ